MSCNSIRKTIAWLLALLFWALPLTALPNQPVLGTVVGSRDTSVGGVALPDVGPILNNDLLTTGPQGRALVGFSPTSRATLLPNTSVRFRSEARHLVAEVTSGTLVVESRDPRGPMVLTPEYKIAPAEQEKTIYDVTLVPDRTTVVAARYGSVAITEIRSGRTYLLPQGKYVQIPASAMGVPAQPAPQGKKSTNAPTGTWHIGSLSHGASIGLAVGIGAGVAAAIAIPLATRGHAVSPSAP